MNGTLRILSIVGLLLTVSIEYASAQSFGKIRGTVVDSETGQALLGANVRVVGLQRGAVTNRNGNFNVLQVPQGTYTVITSYIGYNNTSLEEVTVAPGVTTQLRIELTPKEVRLGEVTVKATQDMVQEDVTATRRVYEREEIETIPGITSSLDVFKMEGGAVGGGPETNFQVPGSQSIEVRAGRLKDIHLRGGRGGEILYLVDGLPITHPIYGGRSVLDLNLSDIERIEVIQGGFSAEYGNAQSAIVKIFTRSGRDRYSGGFRYETDAVTDFLGKSFGRHYGTFYMSGPDPITSQLLPRIGIDALANDVFFFGSISGNLTNTQYNNLRPRETYTVLDALDVTLRQDNKLDLSGKLTYRPNPRLRVMLNYNNSWRSWSPFNWAWVGQVGLPISAKPLSHHLPVSSRRVSNLGLQIRHTVSDLTYYNLRTSYLGLDYQQNLEGLTPPDYWFFGPDTLGRHGGEPIPYSRSISGATTDPVTLFYQPSSFRSNWRQTNTKTYTFKGEVNSQILPAHLVQAGVDLQYHDLNYVDIQHGGIHLSNYGRYITGRRDSVVTPDGNLEVPERPPGPFPLFGQNRWVFNANPVQGAFFLTDKFERWSLIINAGLRLDWFMPGPSVFEDTWVEQWCEATGLIQGQVEDYVCTPTGDGGYAVTWSRIRSSLSPRFGVSFPIFEQAQLYFSYGHFSQLPELQYYYRDPYSGGLTGNPGLGYEETIKYEFGLTYQFADNWSFDVKTYNRDISQEIGTTRLQPEGRVAISLFDNKAYARARGMQFRLENRNRLQTHTSGKLTYTLQWAKGYSSSAFADYRRSQTDFPDPIRERRLNWDVRHNLVFNGTLKSPEGNPLTVFGVSLPTDWRLSVLSYFSSGQPYTPGTVDLVERLLQFNAASGPPTFRTDLKFRKRFNVMGGKFGIFLEVFNLFDQRNVTVGNSFPWFNPWTGEPLFYGDVNQPTQQLYNFYQAYRFMSPQQFTQARRVQVGLRYDF